MKQETYALFKQVKGNVDSLDDAYWEWYKLTTAYYCDEDDLLEAKDMLDFRKHQLISRMKFLITQLEEE